MRGSWLDAHAANVTSQNGEDGIIRLVLQMLPARDAWCVDCGAGDGWTNSNVASLLMPPSQYRCVMIEADKAKAAAARDRWGETGRVNFIHERVDSRTLCTADEEWMRTLEGILTLQVPECPDDFDFLSIDIDGCDLYVWASLNNSKYRPKVICIEYNPTCATDVWFTQPNDQSIRQGCSLRPLHLYAVKVGYRMLAVTRTNAIFVDQEYFGRYGIDDDSPRALRSPTLEAGDVTSVFWGYDGEMFVHGPGKCPWKSCGERDCSDAVDFLNGDPSVVAEAV